jgi:hypothetical protein
LAQECSKTFGKRGLEPLPRNLCTFKFNQKTRTMKNLIRGILAFLGAKKIGGGKCGCFGFIVVFIILYWLLGYVFEVF